MSRLPNWVRRVPGFRSGNWRHAALAACWYVLCLTAIIQGPPEDSQADTSLAGLVLVWPIVIFLPWIVIGTVRWIGRRLSRPRVRRRPTKADPRGAEDWSADAWTRLDALMAPAGRPADDERPGAPASEPVDRELAPTPDERPPPPAQQPEPPTRPRSAAGGSAQREYDRRAAKLARAKAEIRQQHPLLGRLVTRTMHEPQSTTAWARGAAGERHLGAHLDELEKRGAIAMHDRALPRSVANIDHIVVAPSGIWVVDAKAYKGRVEKRDVGGWLRSDVRLYVGGRNRTDLVDAMGRQVQAVRNIVGPDVPIRPALCFIWSDFSLFAMSFTMSGVMVTCVRSLKKAISRRGPLPTDEVARLAALIDEAFPPAV